MKSSQRITRVHLNVKQNDEIFLYGLVTADPDYKLSLALNKRFHINLKNAVPVLLTGENGEEVSFSRFSDSVNSPELIFSLFTNRSGKSYLIKKLKNIDFIFMLHDTENEIESDEILSGLREIESVNAIFKIDINTLKDKNLQHLTH